MRTSESPGNAPPPHRGRLTKDRLSKWTKYLATKISDFSATKSAHRVFSLRRGIWSLSGIADSNKPSTRQSYGFTASFDGKFLGQGLKAARGVDCDRPIAVRWPLGKGLTDAAPGRGSGFISFMVFVVRLSYSRNIQSDQMVL